MEAAEIQDRLHAMQTFVAVQDAAQRTYDAKQAIPLLSSGHTTTKEQIAYHKSHISYLEERAELVSKKHILLADIAEQPETFLPLSYINGLAAAVASLRIQPLKRKATPPNLLGPLRIDAGPRAFTLAWDEKQHKERLAHNIPERALQIGKEIERIGGLFAAEKPLPVAMVWHHNHLGSRRSFNEVLTGHIENPRAFKVKKPSIKASGKLVLGVTTKLTAIAVDEIVTGGYGSKEKGSKVDATITSLRRLMPTLVEKSSLLDKEPDALYIGQLDTAERVAVAEAYNEKLRIERERQEALRNRRRRSPSAIPRPRII